MRYYFDISDRLPIRDQVGRDFKLVSEAVVYAKYLAADLRCLEPDIRPRLSIQVVGEDFERVHEDLGRTIVRSRRTRTRSGSGHSRTLGTRTTLGGPRAAGWARR